MKQEQVLPKMSVKEQCQSSSKTKTKLYTVSCSREKVFLKILLFVSLLSAFIVLSMLAISNKMDLFVRPRTNFMSSIGNNLRKWSIINNNDTEEKSNSLNNYSSGSVHLTSDKTDGNLKKLKNILFYNSYFNMPDFSFGFGQEPFIKHGCPEINCFTTNDKKMMDLEDFDALVFHIRDMQDGKLPIPNQKRRRASQRYVMFLMESPLYDNFPYESYNNFFNWTMTYRLDSDFVRAYGWIEPIGSNRSLPPVANHLYDLKYTAGKGSFLEKKSLEIMNRGKTKSAVWLVSNCDAESERDLFVNELQRFIDVDIMGKCGTMSCSSSDESQCLKQLEGTYRFYLSFENSFCEDYITEKFFKILSYDMIPVVLGSGNYSKIAPAKSFINANDFSSISDLANYLNYLNNNATAYAEYFEWKRYFRVMNDRSKVFCQLCQALHDPNVKPKSYDNIYKWWRTDGHCVKKGRFPWSKTALETSIDFFKQIIS